MPLTLSSQALTTVENVKQVGGKTDDDPVQDQAITLFINAASRLVAEECRREFKASDEETTTRTFPYTTRFVSFGRYDATSVSLVEITPDTSAVTLASTMYQLGPPDKPHGVYSYLRTWNYPLLRTLPQLIRVTGVWGWPAIPEAVGFLTAITVLEWLQRNQEVFSSTFNLDTSRLEVPRSLPSSVISGLNPFRKSVVLP